MSVLEVPVHVPIPTLRRERSEQAVQHVLGYAPLLVVQETRWSGQPICCVVVELISSALHVKIGKVICRRIRLLVQAWGRERKLREIAPIQGTKFKSRQLLLLSTGRSYDGRAAELLGTYLELPGHVTQDRKWFLQSKITAMLQLSEAGPEKGNDAGEVASLVAFLWKDDGYCRIDSVAKKEGCSPQAEGFAVGMDVTLDGKSTGNALLLAHVLSIRIGVAAQMSLFGQGAV